MASPPYSHSHPTSRYGSPVPSQWSGDMYLDRQNGIVRFDAHGSPIPVHAQPQLYGSPPFPVPGSTVSTPPTSSHSQDEGSTGRKPQRTTPAKRRVRNNGDNATAPKLEAPLSVLTTSMTDIPVKDMELWVNRPTEERREETLKRKRKGHIARPMNGFILYRSAYTAAIKRWSEKNNHQLISKVSGASWRMETPEIREHYNWLAKLERENHQKAFPGYKFCPSKNTAQVTAAAAAARTAKEFSDNEDISLDVSDDDYADDDDDPTYRPSRSVKRRSRPTAATAAMQQPGTPENMPYSPYHGIPNDIMAYPLANASGSLLDNGCGYYYPPVFDPAQPFYLDSEIEGLQASGGQHYQQHHYQQEQQYHPFQQPCQSSSIVGLPSDGHNDLLIDHDAANSPASFRSAHIDPTLAAGEYQNAFLGHGSGAGAISEQAFRTYDEEYLAAAQQQAQQQQQQHHQQQQQWPHHAHPEGDADFQTFLRESLRQG